jgi:hypothetical protein
MLFSSEYFAHYKNLKNKSLNEKLMHIISYVKALHLH